MDTSTASINDQLRALGVTGDRLRTTATGINADAASILAALSTMPGAYRSSTTTCR